MLIAAFAVFTLSACEELFVINRAGQPVVFSASSGEDIQTKTAYSGEVVDGKERINWVLGDQVMIYRYEVTFDEWNNPKSYDHKNKIYYIKGIHVGGQGAKDKSTDRRESHGTLATLSESDQFIWDEDASNKKYEFYSVYPASLGNMPEISEYWNRGGYKIEFNLPSVQHGNLTENMQYAYMAAVAAANPYSAVSDRGSVELKYYPMVTTLYIRLKNDTDSNVTLQNVKLNAKTPLAGKYVARHDNNMRKFVPDSYQEISETKNEITLKWDNGGTIVEKDKSLDVAIFILPKYYQGIDNQYNDNFVLSVTVDDKLLQKTFAGISNLQPCYKYNLNLNLSGASTPVEPDPDDPEVQPDPPKIDVDPNDALAQMIFMVINSFQDGDKFYAAFRRFMDKYFDHAKNEHLSFWHEFEKLDKKTVNGAWDRLSSFFGDKFDNFLAELGAIEEITLNTGSTEIQSDTLRLNNALFKNLKKVSLQLNKDVVFELDSMTTLTTFEVIAGSNGTIDLSITDCPNLTTISVLPDGAKVKKLSLIRTPKFQKADIKNMGLSEMYIYLEDCSTDVTNAYISIQNSATQKTVDRSGNTSNVTVR